MLDQLYLLFLLNSLPPKVYTWDLPPALEPAGSVSTTAPDSGRPENVDLFGSVTTESSGAQQVRRGQIWSQEALIFQLRTQKDRIGVWLLSAGAIDPCSWVVWKPHEYFPLTPMREASEELPWQQKQDVTSPRVTQRVRWGTGDKGLMFRARLVDSSSCGEDEEAECKAPAAQTLIGSRPAFQNGKWDPSHGGSDPCWRPEDLFRTKRSHLSLKKGPLWSSSDVCLGKEVCAPLLC